jgi:membrane-bound lytic murein transglycosylase B
MRRLLAAVLASGAAAGVAIAVASDQPDNSPAPAPRTSPAAGALPAPDVALPHAPAPLAAALTATTRRLHDALGRWDGTASVPRDVAYLALHHQRILRLMSATHGLGDATLALLPADVRAEARDTVRGRRDLAAIPSSPGRLPRVRVAPAAPAAQLRRYYAAAQRRFGIDWSILASLNFVESAFGRVRSASQAGARGPMQFLRSTWRAFGMGGSIDAPRDAILAAANLLRHDGAPRHIDAALFAYNHSTAYVRAVRRFAARMHADARMFFTYYAWQVFVRTPAGVRRVTGPGRDRGPGS